MGQLGTEWSGLKIDQNKQAQLYSWKEKINARHCQDYLVILELTKFQIKSNTPCSLTHNAFFVYSPTFPFFDRDHGQTVQMCFIRHYVF